MELTCERCGCEFEAKRPHARFCSDRCRAIDWKANGGNDAGERVLDGVGSRGGNVRSVAEARDVQAGQKSKRDWAGAIDEQILRTLVVTGCFHADDLAPLEVPPEHCNLKGTRVAWFRNQGLMEKTGAERKLGHAAANGRKAHIHRITAKGRRELPGLLKNFTNTAGVDAGNREGNSGASTETLDRPLAPCSPSGARKADVDPGGGETLSLLPEPPKLLDHDAPRAA